MIYLSYNFIDSFYVHCSKLTFCFCAVPQILWLENMPADRKLDARHVRLIVAITQYMWLG